jgi:RNA polymerase sigma-70 factor (ECF subfamily)
MHFWQQRAAAREPVAYLFRAVRNAARNRRRAESRRRRHEQHAAAERMFAAVAVDVEVPYDADDVALALAALPEEQREVVVMKIWGELTFEAIGQALEIPQGTAQSRYRYGLQSLRKTLVARRTKNA